MAESGSGSETLTVSATGSSFPFFPSLTNLLAARYCLSIHQVFSQFSVIWTLFWAVPTPLKSLAAWEVVHLWKEQKSREQDFEGQTDTRCRWHLNIISHQYFATWIFISHILSTTGYVQRRTTSAFSVSGWPRCIIPHFVTGQNYHSIINRSSGLMFQYAMAVSEQGAFLVSIHCGCPTAFCLPLCRITLQCTGCWFFTTTWHMPMEVERISGYNSLLGRATPVLQYFRWTILTETKCYLLTISLNTYQISAVGLALNEPSILFATWHLNSLVVLASCAGWYALKFIAKTCLRVDFVWVYAWQMGIYTKRLLDRETFISVSNYVLVFNTLSSPRIKLIY